MTEVRLNKRVLSVSTRNLKRMVETYTEDYLKVWFIERDWESENIEDPDVSAREEFCDVFVEQLFNDWDTHYSFYINNECSLGSKFSGNDFIRFWISATKWYREEFDTEIEMKSVEHAWNIITFWIFKDLCYEYYETKFVTEFIQTYSKYKEENERTSRISCGVCYENKILYTGCFRCNGNFICKGCFNKIYNECPFCRCIAMICPEPFESVMNNDDFIIWYKKMSDCNSLIVK